MFRQMMSGSFRLATLFGLVAASCIIPNPSAAWGQISQQPETESTKPAESAAEGAAVAPVFCLRTQFFPVAYDPGSRPDRLVRELGRQAVLIAARDGLGYLTRDETLEEPFPDAARRAGSIMNVKVTARIDGKLLLNLWQGETTGETPPRPDENSEAPKPVELQATYLATPYDTYLSMLARYEPMTRTELPAALRKFGFAGEARAANPANEPPQSVEALLLEMNFVSPFIAVRRAHEAIAKQGESAAWLGVLVRGYANLAFSTQHVWSSQQEAFAARALLYAERLVNLSPEHPLAIAHRAYARALVGLHAAALSDLSELERRLEADETARVELPPWLRVIGPYCRFDREALLETAAESLALSQLIQRLVFEQISAYEDSKWLMESAEPTFAICPEDFGVYARLASRSELGIKRTGAYYALMASSRLLAPRLAGSADLPQSVRAAAAPRPGAAVEVEGNPQSNGPFSADLANAAKALIRASDVDAASDPSWAVLGKLIEEELFVEAANFLGVAIDATESSLAEIVDSALPLLKDHRFAWYVKSYTVDPRQEPAAFNKIIGSPKIIDPHGSMARLFQRVWSVGARENQSGIGAHASWQAVLNQSLTARDLVSSVGHLNYVWWRGLGDVRQKEVTESLAAVSPHTPQVVRWKMSLVEKPSFDEIQQWEQAAVNDPVALIGIASLYSAQNRHDDAIRCYVQSIDLSPSYNAHVALAESYRAAGQSELWKPTLLRYLEVPTSGLEHGRIHQTIANYHIERKEWEEAEPHALGAAQTWAAWGLGIAAEVYEALGRWEESEKWVREKSRSYPTSSGLEWYYWCRRTGRGDVAAARKLAEQVMTPGWLAANPQRGLIVFVDHVLEGRTAVALQAAKENVESSTETPPSERTYLMLHKLAVAAELNDQDVCRESIAQIREMVASETEKLNEPDPVLSEALTEICRIADGLVDSNVKLPNAEEIAALRELLDSMQSDGRRNHFYLAGRILELRGAVDDAELFYRQIIAESPFSKHCRTLAGFRLAMRHGTSRQ